MIKCRFFTYIKARILSQKLQLILCCVFGLLSFMQLSMFSGSDSEIEGLSILAFTLSCAGFFIMSYISALNSFNYLHDKNMTDMVISLPINRKPRFWGDFIAGLSVFMAPYIVSALASAPVFMLQKASGNSHPSHMGTDAFKMMVAGFLILLFTYAMTVFAVSLCGRLFEATSVPIIFGILIPASMFLVILITYGNTYGLQYDLDQFMLIVVSTSPFPFAIWSINMIPDYFYAPLVLNEILLAMAVTVLFIVGAYFLNITRKAEDTGKPFPVKVYFHIYISMIGFCIAAVFMYFITMRMENNVMNFYDSNITIPILVTIMIPTTLVFYFLFDVINNKGFKKPLMVLCRWFVTTAATAGICLGLFATGGLGAVSYIPNPSNITSANVNLWHFANITNEYSVYDAATDTWGIIFRQPENIAHVIEFHKLALENRSNTNNSKWHDSYWQPRESISYTLKSLRTVDRTYPVNDNTIAPLKKLLMSDEYKEIKIASVKYLLERERSAVEIYSDVLHSIYGDYNEYGKIYDNIPRNRYDDLLLAYRKDLYAETEEQMFTRVDFDYHLIIQGNAISKDGRYVGHRDTGINIKPHYRNLIALVEEFM